jgi:hypothetical protein
MNTNQTNTGIQISIGLALVAAGFSYWLYKKGYHWYSGFVGAGVLNGLYYNLTATSSLTARPPSAPSLPNTTNLQTVSDSLQAVTSGIVANA